MEEENYAIIDRNSDNYLHDVSSTERYEIKDTHELSDSDFSNMLREATIAAVRATEDGVDCTADHAAQAAHVFRWLDAAIRLDELLLIRSRMLAEGSLTDMSLLNDVILDMNEQGSASYLGCEYYVLQIHLKFTEVKVRQEVIIGEFHLNMMTFGNAIAAKANKLRKLFDDLLRLRIKFDIENPGSSETAAKIMEKYKEFDESYRDISRYDFFDVTVSIYGQTYEFYEFGQGLTSLKARADKLAKLPLEKYLERYDALGLPKPEAEYFTFDTDSIFSASSNWAAALVVPEVHEALSGIRLEFNGDRLTPSPFRVFVDPDTIMEANAGVYQGIQHAYGTAVEFIVYGELDPDNPISDLFPNESDWKHARDTVKAFRPTYIAPMKSAQRLYADWREHAKLEDPDSDLKKLSEIENKNNEL